MSKSFTQSVKDYLVQLGINHILVQTALRMHGLRHGYHIEFPENFIVLRKADRQMILNRTQYIQIPVMLECWNLYFDTMVGETVKGCTVLDFSKPGLHRYRRSGASFYFPSIPEDDVMDAYTHAYTPQAGEVVWDAGAHAGATAFFLSQMVGPSGRVYAFEPDQMNYDYLERNIALHKLSNVIPVKKALAGTSGTAEFYMDGTMGAGLTDYVVYSEKAKFQTVATISFEDACKEFGDVPSYVKMDIEGAEVATIESSQEFLKAHPIHFAIESCHRIDGELTWKPLEKLFSNIGYKVWSSEEFTQMFTWATPAAK